MKLWKSFLTLALCGVLGLAMAAATMAQNGGKNAPPQNTNDTPPMAKMAKHSRHRRHHRHHTHAVHAAHAMKRHHKHHTRRANAAKATHTAHATKRAAVSKGLRSESY